jgi:transketolase
LHVAAQLAIKAGMTNAHATHAPHSTVSHDMLANAIRALSMDAVQQANSGHPGMPMGMADVATVLWQEFLNHDPDAPAWADRDRFVLSAGHGSMLLYSLLYLSGYEDITIEEIKNFRQLGAKTCGHPEYGIARGIETTTGPLGQGIANAVGMALAERLLAARFGEEIVNHHTYCIVGDGCLMEGISQEAASLAAHLQLSKLIILFDDNGISIDGSTSLSTSEDNVERFRALGFDVHRIDGHDAAAIRAALTAAKASDKPSFIACKTTIAYGAPTKAGTSASHGSPLGADEIAGAKAALGITYPAFDIPQDIVQAWQSSTERGKNTHAAWQQRVASLPSAQQEEFTRIMTGELPEGWMDTLFATKKAWAAEAKSQATRQSSQDVLGILTASIPELIGGSADLTGSNLTKTAATRPISSDDFSGRYIYYGVREHAMGAIMNGLALHGGILPYSGTFLVFSDYMRTAIRLSALMHIGVVYVMTHDSIGVGEDGPTHQPIEHLASLRAMPNVHVMRPCDRIETLECWELAVKNRTTPSLLALTRQALPQLRSDATENKSALGAYALRESAEDKAVIIATGSEVHLATQAADSLAKEHIAVRVISMPCMELFLQQSEAYQRRLLGEGLPRIAVEAASSFGWHRIVGHDGTCICLDNFGESAPAPALYDHFGITVQAIINTIKEKL